MSILLRVGTRLLGLGAEVYGKSTRSFESRCATGLPRGRGLGGVGSMEVELHNFEN